MKYFIMVLLMASIVMSANDLQTKLEDQSMDKMWGEEKVKLDALKAGKANCSTRGIMPCLSTGASTHIWVENGKAKHTMVLGNGLNILEWPGFL